MILGIDVGGTHTDAVLVDKSGLKAWAKVPTEHGNLLHSIRSALENIRSQHGDLHLERFNLSTTLCTNAIVQDELAEVGVLVSAGPGIDPWNFQLGDKYALVPGGLDHRGSEIQPLDLGQAREAIQKFLEQGIQVFSVISKFSPRNSKHEMQLADLLQDKCKFLTQGHLLSGQLNFPRRIATSYYNSAVWPIFNDFAHSVYHSLQDMGLNPELNILKADGGTMPLTLASKLPVESIFSGSAASIMGIMALCDIQEDALLLDVGGTTTDVGVFAAGDPLIEPENVEVAHRPTLVRAMKSKSIGLGGDSAISVLDDALCIGPKRMGTCLAQGGPAPTLVDALNCLKSFRYGDIQASIQGMQTLGEQLCVSCEEISRKVVDEACRKIRQETQEMLDLINARPVYTVHEFLEYKKIKPKKLYLMGGPAQVLAPFLSQEFGLPATVPEHCEVANALGAALSRPTQQAELFADTEKHLLSIPVFGIKRSIEAGYSLDQAKQELLQELCKYLKENLHWEIPLQQAEIVEESAMNMIKDFCEVGQDIRVKCQVKPGICADYENSVRCVCKEL
ncbi:MAG: hydantoinase/oxoprolinase family protein [Desulfohalobiaceae bacterium]